MKKQASILILVAILFAATTYAQQINLPGNGKITLKESSSDTVYFIPFHIQNRTRAEKFKIELSDLNTLTADRGKDYEYIDEKLSPVLLSPESPDHFSVGVLVKSRKIKRDTINFELTLSYVTSKGQRDHKKLLVAIEPYNPITPKKQIPDTSKFSVRIITGSNFDFFEGPSFKNFAGDLHIFLPDLLLHKKNTADWAIGLEAGIFNFRYFEADSSNGRIYTERYLLDQNVTFPVVDTTRYIRDQYALNQRVTYNTFGAYLNPIITLPGEKSKWIDLYLSIHFEGLWRTEIQEYNKASLSKDTLTFSQRDQAQNVVLQSTPGLRPRYNKRTFQDTYLGIGLPMQINIKNKFNFYLAPTLGIAYYESIRITDTVINEIRYRAYLQEQLQKPFLLTKAKLVTSVAPVDLALGGEFRRVAGQRSFYAVYFGAAITLDKLKK